jgi:hypothetical protein
MAFRAPVHEILLTTVAANDSSFRHARRAGRLELDIFGVCIGRPADSSKASDTNDERRGSGSDDLGLHRFGSFQ